VSDGFPDIGPGGCGTWSNFDVPTIWSMLAGETGTVSVEQATAWDRTYDLLASHAQNLQTLRDNLAERWPPEQNEASGVFLEYLDKLIGTVQPASYASSTNAVVLSDLVDTLSDARATVEPLHDQWQAAAADPRLQAELNTQAATIMSSTDVAVYQHGQRFVVPPEYEPPVDPIDSTRPFSTDNTSTPSSQVRPLTERSSSPPMRSAGSTDSNGTDAPAILSSQAAAAQKSAPANFGVSRSSSFASTPVGRVLAPGGVIGIGPVRSTVPAYPRFTRPDTGQIRPQHPGSARTSNPTIEEPAANSHSPRSGIGLANAGVTSSGETNGAAGGLLGGVGGPRAQRRNQEQGEPYFEWRVETGVPAVLEAPAEATRHDPGPGVFGIDR
jgi:hypothetical protein